MQYFLGKSWAVLVFTASVASADDLIYDEAVENCSNPYSETRVTFSGDTVSFYESSCTITKKQPVSVGGEIFSLQCDGGTDQWITKMAVAQTSTGITLQVDGNKWTYFSCN